MYQILSQSVRFCRLQKHYGVFFSVHSVDHRTVIAAKFHPNRQSRLPLGQEKEKYGQSPIDHDIIAEDKGCCIGSGHHRFTGNVIT